MMCACANLLLHGVGVFVGFLFESGYSYLHTAESGLMEDVKAIDTLDMILWFQLK